MLTVILAAVMIFSPLSLTAYAAPDGGEPEITADSGEDSGAAPDDGGSAEPDPADEPESGESGDPDPAPAEDGDASDDAPADTPADSGEGGNGYNEYIDNIDDIDADPSYEEPEHLDELPTVSDGEVVEPTAVVLPDVEVTDASLFSGTVMWLCVAVGIAVVVGVMVSKRTRRRS
jgi:hypothetical protein